MPALPLQRIGTQLRQRVDAVVIGASAGGVEALSTLLPALPATLSVAIIIVLHLPRDRRSLLVDIFSHKCACPLREADDKAPVESGTVYFAPPDYHLLVDRGSDRAPLFSLSVDELVNYSRPAIDVLFDSAADFYGERLLGIVLTGANDDGAAGLATICRQGGVAMVQQPDSAQNAYMPQSALKRTPAALALTLEQIAAVLADLTNDQAMDQPHATR
ncbi:chemotaxis protein CheB [Uliginosibacterium sp. H3]|uniref:protein-glutamate methylesterase n=1 Tax=Uliginosibacterium silvisoli TaxID=3114758 RepID=A0ABU6K9X1_9RHOO|nr:chemotaxis protein CheB [Uliginosibacterium sp. H3]